METNTQLLLEYNPLIAAETTEAQLDVLPQPKDEEQANLKLIDKGQNFRTVERPDNIRIIEYKKVKGKRVSEEHKNKDWTAYNNRPDNQLIYITLQTLDEIFSVQTKYPLNYNMILNFIRGQVTARFHTFMYDRKEEIAFDALNYCYKALKKKLIAQKEEYMKQGITEEPCSVFRKAQFWNYISMATYCIYYHGTHDLRNISQEPELHDSYSNYGDDSFNRVGLNNNEDAYANRCQVGETLHVEEGEVSSVPLEEVPDEKPQYLDDDRSYKAYLAMKRKKEMQLKNFLDGFSELNEMDKRMIRETHKNTIDPYNLTPKSAEGMQALKEKLEANPELAQKIVKYVEENPIGNFDPSKKYE